MAKKYIFHEFISTTYSTLNVIKLWRNLRTYNFGTLYTRISNLFYKNISGMCLGPLYKKQHFVFIAEVI